MTILKHVFSAKHSHSAPKRNRRRRLNRLLDRKPRLENLEGRYLLAVLSEPNEILVRLNPTDSGMLDIVVDDDVTTVAFSPGEIVELFGQEGDDTLNVDVSGGVIPVTIRFDGGEGTDSLVVTGDPGSTIGRETYLVGATEDAGTWVLDPDDSAGPGALAGGFNGDEMLIEFAGLEPADTNVPAAIFDVVFGGVADDARIEDGGLLAGDLAIRVVDLSATFETFRFANKATVRLSGNSGEDTFRIEYVTAAAGLTDLEVYGHLAPGVPGPADDDSRDDVLLHSTDNVTTTIATQGGSDRIEERSLIMDALNGTINIAGGESAGDNDYLSFQDINDAGPDLVTFTDSSITGMAPATINYAEFEKVLIETTSGGDTIDVLSTNADTETLITGGPGDDMVTIGNEAADFGTTFDGSLDAIAGPLAVSGDFNAPDGSDTLNVDDSGTVSLSGVATIDTATYTYDLAGVGTTFTGPVTVLDQFAPAPIRYFYDTIAPFGFNPRMENVAIQTSTGNDDLRVRATTASQSTTLSTLGGDDSVRITGDRLSAANAIQLGQGADEIFMSVSVDVADDSFADLTSVVFDGGDAAGSYDDGDLVRIVDVAPKTRDLVFDYLDTAGDLDINPAVGGGLGVGVEDVPIEIRSMERVDYRGTDAGVGLADNVRVVGTSADDDLTVVPTASPSGAFVFLGGDPWDGPSEGDLFDQFPGIAGGGTGPDLSLVDVAAPGLVIDGGGTGVSGDRLYVYGTSEASLIDTGTSTDPFLRGVGTIIQGSDDTFFQSAYDQIEVSDSEIRIVNDRAVLGAVPPSVPRTLLPILPVAGSFAQTDPSRPGLIVNAGFEDTPAVDGIADDIVAFGSPVFAIRINGGDPNPAGAPQGDRLQIFGSGAINVYSDKSVPPTVTTTPATSGTATLPLSFTSIESTVSSAGPLGQIVNLIGDNNDPTVDQNDNFVVVGRDVDSGLPSLSSLFPGAAIDPRFEPDADGDNEFTLEINGSLPIAFRNVTQLNVFGDDRPDDGSPGTPSAGPNDIDTLEITPYADDTPQGWGIDMSFDEGNPVGTDGDQTDLIVYHTSLVGGAVSEDITIRPSGPDNGEIIVVNSSTGTSILDLDYVGNTDIIVIDDDGFLNDTDTLTLLGTNPDTPQNSGADLFTANFTAAGTPAEPIITVADEGGSILYRVRELVGFPALAFEGLGGNDSLAVLGQNNGVGGYSSELVTFQGGSGNDLLRIDNTPGLATQSGGLQFEGGLGNDGILLGGELEIETAIYSVGPEHGDGEIVHDGGGLGIQTVTFSGLEPVIDVVPSAQALINATNSDNAITLASSVLNPAWGMVSIDGFEPYHFANKDNLQINALGGRDTINLNYQNAASAVPLGLTGAVTVNGGNPSESDELIVNTRVLGTGIDELVVTPLAQGHGTIASLGMTANYQEIEDLTLVGDATETDGLGIDGSVGDDVFRYFSDDTPDTGRILASLDGEAFTSPEISYVGFSSDSVRRFNNFGIQGGTDTFVFEGSSASDFVRVDSGILLEQRDGSNFSLIETGTPSSPSGAGTTTDIVVRTHDGEDFVRIGPSEAGVGVSVDGGQPDSGSDTLLYLGSGNNISMDPSFISEAGFRPTNHVGFENVRIDGDSAALTALFSGLADELIYRPQGPQSGAFQWDGDRTLYQFVNVNDSFDVVGLGRQGDKVTVEGTNSHDQILVDSPNRMVTVSDGIGTVLKSVALDASIESVSVLAGDGNDTILVEPAPTVGPVVNANLLVDVDGGKPGASDALVIATAAGATLPASDFVVHAVGLNAGEGRVRVYRDAIAMPDISYTNTEIVSPNVLVDGGVPQLLVLGPDASEPNQYRTTATHLGAGDAINVDHLAIFPAGGEHPGVPADTDFFQIVAAETGILDVTAYFETYDPMLFPEGGQLGINALDASGNVIAGAGAFGNPDASPNARVRFPAVAGQTYVVSVFGANAAGGPNNEVVNGYELTVINDAPPAPYAMELSDNPADGTTNPPGGSANSDTGRSQFDHHTYDDTPTLFFRLDDGIFLNDLPGNPATDTPPDEIIPIPFQAGVAQPVAAGYAIAVFDEGSTPSQSGTATQIPLGFATAVAGQQGIYQFTVPAAVSLSEGSHFLTARVQMIDPATTQQTGFGPRSEPLEVVIDVTPPPITFGDPGSGLHPDSDSGDPGLAATQVDRITNDLTPTFFGRAEADSIVRAYVDADDNGLLNPAVDVLIGQTVATPLDGTNQAPRGEWEIDSTVNMNDPGLLGGLGLDGLRRIFVTAEDLAGNITAPDNDSTLEIVIDTQGPQVTSVFISDDPAFDLFTLKPETPRPTPRVDSLTVGVQDLPARVVGFLYQAVSNVPPLAPLVLTGDHTGVIAISNLAFNAGPLVPGVATGEIVMDFSSPLRDDRYTLTIDDSVIDPAGNRIDGENNAAEPIGAPFFPTGDQIPGGDFVARFTIDSRPEVATWSQGVVYADINGNFVWDPEGQDNDATNRDFAYHFAEITDSYFAGNFSSVATSSGFDKLGAYGAFGGTYEFLIDTDDDGVGDLIAPMAHQVNAIPVAGNFFVSAADNAALAAGQRPRDEIGAFDGQNWYLDVNGNNQIDLGEQFATNLRGLPMVGDFNGDGNDDLATFDNSTGVFEFDLNRDGTADNTVTFQFSGFGDYPIAGDMNLDGIDDIGLWIPGRDGQLPKESGEFHFLISDRQSPQPSNVFDSFSPSPLGNDLMIQFGDEFALALLGNFDPPINPDGSGATFISSLTNPLNPFDTNMDGSVSARDALAVINAVARDVGEPATRPLRIVINQNSYRLDVSQDGQITALDALRVINYLQRNRSNDPTPENERSIGVQDWTRSVDSAIDDDHWYEDELLLLLADDRSR